MVMRYPMLRSLSTRTSIVEEVMPEPRVGEEKGVKRSTKGSRGFQYRE